MTLPMYSIQRDNIWPHDDKVTRASLAPSASIYSADYHPAMDEDSPPVLPLKVSGQHTQNRGHSKLPIFKQVRSLLHRPPALQTSNNYVKPKAFAQTLDPHETTESGHEAHHSHAPGRGVPSYQDQRSLSPVSALEAGEDTIYPSSPPQLDFYSRAPSPVSPVSGHAGQNNAMPTPASTCYAPLPGTPVANIIKRKPAPQRYSISTIDEISPPPSRGSEDLDFAEFSRGDPKSHFSWTTCAPSIRSYTAETPRLIDIPARHRQQQSESVPRSHFSWSTVGTQQIPLDSPPASPPPSVPSKYRTPPVQSILSRQRPIQRMDRDQYTAPPRTSSLPGGGLPTENTTSTPSSTASNLNVATRATAMSDTHTPGSGKKTLPLPPDMLTPVSPLSHLEALDRAEADKAHQRQNLERAILECSKLENASPMDVPFATVRDAKKRLEQLKATLAEIRLEEREIGIAISRARRKEGEEEGLWVRRVTG
ncbi:hypothetical protein TI39_contig5852g00010 [Zymoseptoria brevis]|uniref:Uncharacterized protein n=1 Tax=Zymoseptoria brevis TaxID=1047168 RepID=A0A0F4G5Y5_9PEZI|nr:hypothetical protein TI39_contig5852g00010 [Zymoseptoria brevis]